MSPTTNVVCPNCVAVNRIPSDRLSDRPKCGKCGHQIFLFKPLDLTSKSFYKYINNNEIPVLVDFWAAWCGPCKMMAPSFEKAASALEPGVRLAKLNTESEQEIATRFDIRSIPTMILFRGGKEIARQSGALMGGQIEQWVSDQLN